MLSTTDRRIGMYQLIQHGARLDSEFFPESLVRRTWPSDAEYCRFLLTRRRPGHRLPPLRPGLKKNEQKLLRSPVVAHRDACTQGVNGRHIVQRRLFDVYAINRPVPTEHRPHGVDDATGFVGRHVRVDRQADLPRADGLRDRQRVVREIREHRMMVQRRRVDLAAQRHRVLFAHRA